MKILDFVFQLDVEFTLNKTVPSIGDVKLSLLYLLPLLEYFIFTRCIFLGSSSRTRNSPDEKTFVNMIL